MTFRFTRSNAATSSAVRMAGTVATSAPAARPAGPVRTGVLSGVMRGAGDVLPRFDKSQVVETVIDSVQLSFRRPLEGRHLLDCDYKPERARNGLGFSWVAWSATGWVGCLGP